MADSELSLFSQDSYLSIASKGSVLSIGSVGSALSIGSIGSAASASPSARRPRSVGALGGVLALDDVLRDGGRRHGRGRPQAARLTVAILLSAGVLIGLGVLKASRA